MKVIETYLRGKRPDQTLCEDAYVLGEHFAALIDGVTAKTALRYPPAGSGGERRSPGRFAADVVSACLGAADFDGRLRTMAFADLLRELDACLHDAALQAVCSGATLRLEDWPRACLVLYNDYRHEVWSYGDCQCIVDGKVMTHEKEVDLINAARRCTAIEKFLAAGGTEDEVRAYDPGRDAIKTALIAQLKYENVMGSAGCLPSGRPSLGYPVLNGLGIEPSLAAVHPVLEGGDVALASDGYPAGCLCATLAESEARLQIGRAHV